MKIVIFGAGGVGGYFGALLAGQGEEVHFIARGAHLEAMKREGLRIRSVHGGFHLAPVSATNDPATLSPPDYVVVAVKRYDLPAAAEAMQPLVGEETTLVPLLNGIDAHEVLGEAFGRQRVVGGLCSIISYVERPGVIRQQSQLRRIILGELSGEPSRRVARLLEAWRRCGVEATESDDILAAIWTKFLFIASLGGVSSLARTPIGVLREIPESRLLLGEAMREVQALAHAQSIALKEDCVPEALAIVDGLEFGATSSMQRDVAAGKRFELEAFSGTIVRLGAELGVPTPVHRALDALLRPALRVAQEKA